MDSINKEILELTLFFEGKRQTKQASVFSAYQNSPKDPSRCKVKNIKAKGERAKVV